MSNDVCPCCGRHIPRKLSPEEQVRFNAMYLHQDTFRELKLVEQQTFRRPGYTYSHSDWRVVIIDGYGNIRCYLTGDCRDKAEGERIFAEMKQEESVHLAKEEEYREFQLIHASSDSELRRTGPRY